MFWGSFGGFFLFSVLSTFGIISVLFCFIASHVGDSMCCCSWTKPVHRGS